MKLNGVEYENPEAILEVRQYSDKRNKLIQDLYRHYVSLRYIHVVMVVIKLVLV